MKTLCIYLGAAAMAVSPVGSAFAAVVPTAQVKITNVSCTFSNDEWFASTSGTYTCPKGYQAAATIVCDNGGETVLASTPAGDQGNFTSCKSNGNLTKVTVDLHCESDTNPNLGVAAEATGYCMM